MSEAKVFTGTPGPWKADGNLIGTVSKPNCIAIAYRTNANLTNSGILAQDEEMEANARLIAASPTMLEALQSMVSEFTPEKYDIFCDHSVGVCACSTFEIIEKAQAAISKALNQS